MSILQTVKSRIGPCTLANQRYSTVYTSPNIIFTDTEAATTEPSSACLYGTETLALTELQQHRLQVCENNWVRKIARVTRADRRRMVELREETGVQRSLTERLARSRVQWAGHVERMADERLPLLCNSCSAHRQF